MYNYTKTRRQVLENQLQQHGYTFCEFCNTSNGIFDTHHIYFRSEKPNHKNLHSIENLLIVCRNCHAKLHANKSLRNDIIKQRNLDALFIKKSVDY